jgi:5-formyltetrahydrofolate cyclo-ligase
MNQDVTAQKAAMRANMIKRLRELTAEDRESLSDEICERVLETEAWQGAQSILIFSPLPSEPIITPLKIDCEVRKVVCANIPQSARSESGLHLPDEIDLILVPGLVFTQDRHRLGRGGGFFDRLLAGRGANAFKLGICFSFQILDAVPIEGHDTLMDAVVTDSILIKK